MGNIWNYIQADISYVIKKKGAVASDFKLMWRSLNFTILLTLYLIGSLTIATSFLLLVDILTGFTATLPHVENACICLLLP